MFDSEFIEGWSMSSYGTQKNFEGNELKFKQKYKLLGLSIDFMISNKMLEIPDYIKIDVDGNEHDILDGAQLCLRSDKLKSILIEVNENYKEQFQGIISIMKKYNFFLKYKKRNEILYKNFSKSYNYIFEKKMKIKILDSFLNKEDLQELSSLNLKKVLKNEVKVYHNTINQNNDIQSECISKESMFRLQKNYHNKAIDILNELNPKKVPLYDYSEFHIIETGADYVFPIHDDTPNKLLSGVVYLRPENNTGTIFYENKNGDGRNEVPWKVNRAVFFQGLRGKLALL